MNLRILKKVISLAIVVSLALQQTGFAQLVVPLGIPAYINGYVAPDKFRPVQLRSLFYDQISRNLNFYLDKGDIFAPKKNEVNDSAKKLFEYFQIGLILPNDSFWVNLRPDSEDRIIDPKLERTDLGKAMLEADLQLKKDMALFTSPRTAEGKKYWDKLYAKAQEIYANSEITIPTVTRPWIVPGEIVIRQSKDNAYIYKATLRVMLEQDYLKDAPGYNFTDPRMKELNGYSSQLIRQDILPKLTREVNSSQKYATLRQVYYSLILAQWFKRQYRSGGNGNPYSRKINSGDLSGLTSKDSWSKDTYFKAYKHSFADGEYNIRESSNSLFGATVRQYFSGGLLLGSEVEKALDGGGILDLPIPPVLVKGLVPFQADKGIVEAFQPASAVDRDAQYLGLAEEDDYALADGGINKLAFGTSGLRGLVSDMTDRECYINARGYIRWLKKTGVSQGGIKGQENISIPIAGDLRPSTDRIMKAVAKAIEDEGLKVINSGKIPSPALPYYAIQKGVPSLVVTGSHIPHPKKEPEKQRNGIKPNKTTGEVLKSDEKGIKDEIEEFRKEEDTRLGKAESLFDDKHMFKQEVTLPPVDRSAEEAYVRRYLDVFPKGSLKGKRIVFYQHSAVGRDIIEMVLKELGAEVISVERSEEGDFVAVDTEVLPEDLLTKVNQWVREYKPFAVIYADGDSDRPGIFDEKGRFIWGDLLGILVSQYLKADFAAVTISSNDAVYKALAGQARMVKTQIGSPYVVKAMQDAAKQGFKRIVSWEGNGGFLLQSELELHGKILKPLPTRDSILPILSVLLSAAEQNKKVSQLVEALPPRFKHSDLKKFEEEEFKDINKWKEGSAKIVKFLSPQDENIEEVGFKGDKVDVSYKKGEPAKTFSVSDPAVSELLTKKTELERVYFGKFGKIVEMNMLDGVRIQFADNKVLHFRPSGNAPEFRCYATADSQKEAEAAAKIGLEEVLPRILADLKAKGALNYLKDIEATVNEEQELRGFDYVSSVMMNDVENKEVDARYQATNGKGILKPNTKNIPIAPTWNGKAGNGMGTVVCIEDFISKLKDRTGKDLTAELVKNKSAVLIHTAGDATRIAIARAENNKPLIKITQDVTIMDGTIKQSQGMNVPGKLLITWGDQWIFPSVSDLREELSKLSKEYQVLLFGIDYPVEQFTETDAKSFGWQVIVDGNKIIGFDDTRNYAAIMEKITELKKQYSKVTIRWNMGSFALSPEVIEMFLDAFKDELSEKTGSFNSDEVWQAWVAKDKETFIIESSTAKDKETGEVKVDDKKRKQAEYIWAKVDPIKQKLIERYGAEHLIGSVGLGDKLNTPQFDFGTNVNYVNSLKKLLSDDLSGKVIREFIGLERTNGGIFTNSIKDKSFVGKGSVRNSVLIDANIKEADIENCIIQHSTVNTKVTGRNGVLFNVAEFKNDIDLEDGWMIFDVFHPTLGKFRFRFVVGEEQKDKKEWWSVPVHGNPMSLEDLSKLIGKVSRDQVLAAKEEYIRQAALPLALTKTEEKKISVPGWPSVSNLEALSRELKTFLELPGIVDNLTNGKYRYGFHVLYALAYVRQLKTETRDAVLSELRVLGSGELASLLASSFDKELDELIPAVERFLGDSIDKDALTKFVKLHDQMIARDRGLRIALETNGGEPNVLSEIAENPEILQVTMGLRPAAIVEGIKDAEMLNQALWGLKQIEGIGVYTINLGNGKYVIYDEYKMKYAAAEQQLTLAVTRAGLEHLIKIDMARGNGLFFDLLQTEVDENEVKMAEVLARSIFTGAAQERFIKWDNTAYIYRSEGLGDRVFEIEKSPVDTVFVATEMRPEGMINQLQAELENWKIFGMKADVVVIDGSDNRSQAVFDENRANLSKLSLKYGVRIAHLDAKNVFVKDITQHADNMLAIYNSQLEKGTLDKGVESILRDRGVFGTDNKIERAKMINYLMNNIFRHISGARNYTVLLGKGERVIMNVDDDAPPETYVLKKEKREALIAQRSSKREELMREMAAEISWRIGEEIDNEARLYAVFADSAKAEKVRDIEAKYFAYNPKENTGLIPQAMEQIRKKENQYLDKVTSNGEREEGLGTELKLTHQRYQSLMDIADYMVAVSDFVYYRPRSEKKDNEFDILPVNTMRAARLIDQKVKDTGLPMMERDLRGTMAEPVSDAQIRGKLKEKALYYIAYPFILDQDTSGLAQFIRYLEVKDKIAKNLQHTDQMALIAEGVSGFSGDTYVIFNRAALSNRTPTPSIGRDLRLEEPPYIVWVAQPIRQDTITMAYSPVAGAQQRSIDERLYIISNQDFTELVGGAARGFYELAVKNYYAALAVDKALQADNKFDERMRLLGKNYIDVANEFKLDREQQADLMKQREIRAMLASELGRQRGEKQAELDQERANSNPDSAKVASLEKQIRDMDLIIVNFANSFYLSKYSKDADKDNKPNIKNNFTYRMAGNNYMYRISVEGESIHWQAVRGECYVDEIAAPKAIKTGWIDIPGKSGLLDKSKGDTKQLLQIEPGRYLSIRKLPSPGTEMIAVAITDELQAEYINAISKKAADQIKSDGEVIYLWPDLLKNAKNWREDYHSQNPQLVPISDPGKAGQVDNSYWKTDIREKQKDGGRDNNEQKPKGGELKTLDGLARQAAMENDNAKLEILAQRILRIQEEQIKANLGKFGTVGGGITLAPESARKFINKLAEKKSSAATSEVIYGSGAAVNLQNAAIGLGRIFIPRIYTIKGLANANSERLVLYYTAAGLKQLYQEQSADRKKDGGINDDFGGIDLRNLPAVIQPMIGSAAGVYGNKQLTVSELEKQWSDIRGMMIQGQMPYNQIKEYVGSCSGREDTANQMETVFACISGILKMEEERALATAPEIKEILAYFG